MKQLFLAVTIAFMLGALLSHAAFAESERDVPPPIDLLNLGPEYDVPGNRDARSLPYFDEMESGWNGWIPLGLFRQIENPDTQRVMRPFVNPLITIYPDGGYLPEPISGTHVWGYGDRFTKTFMGFPFPLQFPLSGGTSFIPTVGTLISPPIDLTSVSNAKLTFWTWWEIEAVDSDRYDLLDVQIDYNEGLFRHLELLNPLIDIDLTREQSWMAYSSGGLGKRGMWVKKCYDLSDHVGHTVRIRFVFTTRDNLYNGFRGWFIDDVRVEEGTFDPPQINELDRSAGIINGIFHIYGENFTKATKVKVAGPITTVTAVSRTWSCGHIKAKIPNMSQGLKDIIVENPDGESFTLEDGLNVTFNPPPVVMGIYPLEGENDTATEVTIIGTTFDDGATAYLVGDESVTQLQYVSVGDFNSTLTATVPAGISAGFKGVKVINPDTQYDEAPLAFHVANPGEAFHSTIIINEIMQNPDAVSDDMGEWFELYNSTLTDIDLMGWTISDSSGESHTITSSLIVPSEDYIVLGNNDDTNTNGGVDVDYEYNNFTLGNEADEILLYAPGNDLVDKVEYDGGEAFPDPTGRSMELRLTRTDNNIGFNWTRSVEQFTEDGDFGTPGEENGGSSTRSLIFPEPLSLDFGDSTAVGDTDTLQLYLGNLGQITMFITDITSDNPIFEVDIPTGESLPDTVKGGGALIVNINFSPQKEDTLYTGTITITSTAHNGYTLEIPISGGQGVIADPDVNDDGLIDILDLEELISKFGEPFIGNEKYDLVDDDEINLEDVKALVDVLYQQYYGLE
jgi:hypothetical protein